MNEEDRNAADDWIRDNMPDPAECSLEDNEEEGDTQSYFFLRYRDSAIVVYKVAVKDGKVYHGQSSQEKPDAERWLVKPKAYGSRSRPSLHLERVAGERTVFRLGEEINGRDWRFQARRLETGVKNCRLPVVSDPVSPSNEVAAGCRRLL